MITLKNTLLQISIVHPEDDSVLSGARYCHGCYIRQVEDLTKGALLSGPAYPDPSPDIFDGQGMPEAFESALASYPSSKGDSVCVIGVGEVLRSSDHEPFHVRWNPEVLKRCIWDIQTTLCSVKMSTEQSFRGYHFILTKQIQLNDWTVFSTTQINNIGPNPLPVKWFAHPFFPITKDMSCCKLSLPVTVPQNPGFFLRDDQFICMDPSYNWKNGCYRSLGIPWKKKLEAVVNHPAVAAIRIECSYAPTWLPIWANANTFSIEPFLAQTVTPGTETHWGIQYTF